MDSKYFIIGIILVAVGLLVHSLIKKVRRGRGNKQTPADLAAAGMPPDSTGTPPGDNVGPNEPKSNDTPKREYKPVLCDINDTITRTEYREVVSKEVVEQVVTDYGNMGRQWNLEGKRVYSLVKRVIKEKGVEAVHYEPVKIRDWAVLSPLELFHDLKQYEIPIIMKGLKGEKSVFQKYGQILVWAGIMAFIIIMPILSKVGGGK